MSRLVKRTRGQHKLTEKEVKNAGPKAILSDGDRLYVRARTFVFRYVSPATGRERDISLGSVDSVRLQTARKQASTYRELIDSQHIDPHDHEAQQREKDKAEAAANITFGEVAAQWMEERLPDRKSIRNQKAVRSIIETHLKPLANIPIASVNSAAIAAAVKPLEDRLAQRDNTISLVHSIFDWAMAADIIPETLNPARRKKLDKLLPKSKPREVKHNRFVALAELPGFMARLAMTPGNLARCLEFVIHTALRQNEAVNLRWSWVDLSDRSLTIPASSMKAAKPHVVYLSNRAHEIILSMIGQRRAGGLVFPGGSEIGGIGLRSLRTFIVDRFPDIGSTQVHGARASFKGFCTNANLNRVAVEASLAHSVGGAVETAYLNPSDIRAARQTVMDAWSEFLAPTRREDDTNVVSLHAS